MSGTDGYSGWKNRETWCAKLWMDNDEGMYREYRHQAGEVGYSVYEFEKWLEEYFFELQELVKDKEASSELISMILDIGSLWRIDYREIAESVCEELIVDQDTSGAVEIHVDCYVGKNLKQVCSEFLETFGGTAEETLKVLEDQMTLENFTLNSFDDGDEQLSLDWGGVTVLLRPTEHDDEGNPRGEDYEVSDEDKLHLLKLHTLLKAKTKRG